MGRIPALALATALATGGLVACTGGPAGDGAGQGGAESQASGGASADVAVSTLAGQFETVSGYLISAAEQVSEEDYAFSPTEEVRSLGGILGHVAGAHFAYCSSAAGEEAPAAADQEAESKAQVVEKLQASQQYCLDVYRQTTAQNMGAEATIFGNQTTRFSALVSNLAHDNQHYGNIVTYMRSIDMVPPSSQGG